MIDIKYLREKPEEIKARIKKREMNLDSVVDEILTVDAQKREQMGKIEAMKAEKNAASKQIPQIKKAGGDASEIMAKMKEIGVLIAEGEAVIKELDDKQTDLLLSLPNLPDEDVCAGGKEQNEAVRYFGEKPQFAFPMKNHVELCENLGMIDYQRGAKIAGAGSWLYRGWGSRLEWALLYCRRICLVISVDMLQDSSRSSEMKFIGYRIPQAMMKSSCCRQQKQPL